MLLLRKKGVRKINPFKKHTNIFPVLQIPFIAALPAGTPHSSLEGNNPPLQHTDLATLFKQGVHTMVEEVSASI